MMNTLTIPPIDNIVVEQTRVIKASREKVFRAWTEAETLKQWFGPAGMHCPSVDLDVRTGGLYRIDVHPDPGTTTASGNVESSAMGKYTKIVAHELIQFTWVASWNVGEESLVTITLRDVAGGTELHLRHEKLMSDQSCRGYQNGWAGSLKKLAALLECQG